MTDDYEVGYGKPPVKSRFKAGAPSPNAKGRPKGRKNAMGILDKILSSKVTIQENGQKRVLSREETAFLQIVNGAMAGNPKSISALCKLLPHLQKYREGREEAAKKKYRIVIEFVDVKPDGTRVPVPQQLLLENR